MSQADVKCVFGVHEVVVLSGFTKYMLDYLARENIFRATGGAYGVRGRQRLYTFEDVVLLRALHRICGVKGRIRNLSASLAALRDEIGSLKPGQDLDRVVFVDGNELSVWTEKESGRHLRTGQMSFGFLLDLKVVHDELSKVISFDEKASRYKLSKHVAMAAEEVRQEFWTRIRRKRAGGK